MHFLGRARRWSGRQSLWRLVEEGVLRIHEEIPRMMALMEKYDDLPRDLADSSIVVAAESLGVNRVFTLDRDFTVYRINGTQAFEVFPLR